MANMLTTTEQQHSQYSDLLQTGQPRVQTPVWRQEIFLFSTPVQNSPGAHPASPTMDTGALSQG
jgi:hypothetical protein